MHVQTLQAQPLGSVLKLVKQRIVSDFISLCNEPLYNVKIVLIKQLV
jgi:hypothetical protein